MTKIGFLLFILTLSAFLYASDTPGTEKKAGPVVQNQDIVLTEEAAKTTPLCLLGSFELSRVKRAGWVTAGANEVSIRQRDITTFTMNGGIAKEFHPFIAFRIYGSMGFGDVKDTLVENDTLLIGSSKEAHHVRFGYSHFYMGVTPEILFFTSLTMAIKPYAFIGAGVNYYSVSLYAKVEDNSELNGQSIDIEEDTEESRVCVGLQSGLGMYFKISRNASLYGQYKFRYWKPNESEESMLGKTITTWEIQNCHGLEIGVLLAL
jgi:hypothetical protein